MRKLLPSLALMGAIVLPFTAQAQTLTLQSAFPFNLTTIHDSVNRFVATTDEVTEGRVKFKSYDTGVMSPPFEILENVSNGSLDAGWSASSYWAGQIPAAALFQNIPFGPDVPKYLAWLYSGGGLELWQELYAPHNVVPIPCGSMVSEAGGWFNKPVTQVADLKGVNMRISGLGAKIISKLGVTASSLSAGETYLGLETGRIGAAELSFPSIDQSAGFYQVSKNYYFPGWHQPGSLNELIINGDVWKAMKKSDQTAVKNICADLSLWMYANESVKQNTHLDYFRSQGVSIKRFPDDVMAALRKATDEVLAEESGKDADFKRVLASYQAFSVKYDEYAELSRLK